MEKEEFKLTLDEVLVLEKIADATHNDEWFRIDEDLHAHDAEGNFGNASEAELVEAVQARVGQRRRRPPTLRFRRRNGRFLFPGLY